MSHRALETHGLGDGHEKLGWVDTRPDFLLVMSTVTAYVIIFLYKCSILIIVVF